MSKSKHNQDDIPGLSWPRWARITWLLVTPVLSIAALLNLIYMVEVKPASAPSTLPSAELHNPVPVPAVLSPEDKGEVAVICDLIDVSCAGENPVPVQAEVVIAPVQKAAAIPARHGTQAPIKKGAPAWMQERINYAWQISKDLDFILMMEYENEGTWAVDKLSKLVGANGYRDKGICQINIGYHQEVVFDPQFKDWKWQIDTCHKMYKGGVRFYGFDHRMKRKQNFIIAKE